MHRLLLKSLTKLLRAKVGSLEVSSLVAMLFYNGSDARCYRRPGSQTSALGFGSTGGSGRRPASPGAAKSYSDWQTRLQNLECPHQQDVRGLWAFQHMLGLKVRIRRLCNFELHAFPTWPCQEGFHKMEDVVAKEGLGRSFAASVVYPVPWIAFSG